jgi:hypothetical protein
MACLKPETTLEEHNEVAMPQMQFLRMKRAGSPRTCGRVVRLNRRSLRSSWTDLTREKTHAC